MNQKKPIEAGADKALVSVVIRTCDRPSLLEQAVQSVIRQDYPAIEIVLINEGEAIADTLLDAINQSPVQLTLSDCPAEGPRGRTAAAQTGLDMANGEYLCFLDDDDWFESHHISGLIHALKNNPVSAVYSSVACVKAADPEHTIIKTYQQSFDRSQLLIENFIPIHAVLFKTSLLEKGLCFDPTLAVYEDWDFWLQLSEQTHMQHIDQVSAFYRVSEAGSGLHKDARLQEEYKEKLWAKWRDRSSQSDYYALLRSLSQTQQLHQQIQHLEQVTDSEAKQRDAEIDRQRTELKRLNDEIQRLNDEILRLNGDIQHRNNLLDQQGAELSEHQHTITRLESQRREKEAQINHQAKIAEEKDKHYDHLQQVNQQLNETSSNTLKSVSGKLSGMSDTLKVISGAAVVAVLVQVAALLKSLNVL